MCSAPWAGRYPALKTRTPLNTPPNRRNPRCQRFRGLTRKAVRLAEMATRSTRYLADHLADLRSRYLGKWVFIHNGRFVAAHEDPEQGRALVRGAGIDPAECIAEFMASRRDRSYFF